MLPAVEDGGISAPVRMMNLKMLSMITALIMVSVGFSGIFGADTNTTPTRSSPTNVDIMIFAPHPDDEALGCAGVIYDALQGGESVRVAVMTNGDAAGVFDSWSWDATKDHNNNGIKDRVDLGYERQIETVNAMDVLGLPEDNIMFFGYPDGHLLGTDGQQFGIWSENYNHNYNGIGVVKSDATNEFQSPYEGEYYHHLYNRENVLNDIESVLLTYEPKNVYVTHSRDIHSDHQATNLFVTEAIRQTGKFRNVYSYLVHWDSDNNWPKPAISEVSHPSDRYDSTRTLDPPEDFPRKDDRLWRDLSTDAIQKKDEAINEYQTQIDGDDNYYLRSFIRMNEISWVEYRFLFVPFLDQGSTNWCFPNSLAMVMQYYGKQVHGWDIASAWKFGHEDGVQTWAWMIINADLNALVQSYGLLVDGPNIIGTWNFNYYKKHVDLAEPVMVCGITTEYWGLVDKGGHCIVVTGYRSDASGDYLYVHDPSGAFTLAEWGLSKDPPIYVEISWEKFKSYFVNLQNLFKMYTIVVYGAAPNPPAGAMYLTDGNMKHTSVWGNSGSLYLGDQFAWIDPIISYKANGQEILIDEDLDIGVYVTNHYTTSRAYQVNLQITGPLPSQTTVYNDKIILEGSNAVPKESEKLASFTLMASSLLPGKYNLWLGLWKPNPDYNTDKPYDFIGPIEIRIASNFGRKESVLLLEDVNVKCADCLLADWVMDIESDTNAYIHVIGTEWYWSFYTDPVMIGQYGDKYRDTGKTTLEFQLDVYDDENNLLSGPWYHIGGVLWYSTDTDGDDIYGDYSHKGGATININSPHSTATLPSKLIFKTKWRIYDERWWPLSIWIYTDEIVSVELSTSALTAPPAAGEFSIETKLESNADLHFYDPLGRHTGINYETMQVEKYIPGSSYANIGGIQYATLTQLMNGAYLIKLVGTSNGSYRLTIEGYERSTRVYSETYSGTITNGEVLGVFVNVSGLPSSLNIHTTKPVMMSFIDQKPVADAGPDQVVYEGDTAHFDCSRSYDPDGAVVSYEWDFNGDGKTDAYGPVVTFVWYDDFVQVVTCTVTTISVFTTTDGEGNTFTHTFVEKATDSLVVIVLNKNPAPSIDAAYMYIDFTLRVAGEKYHDVEWTLYEKERGSHVWDPIRHLSVTRYPGSPNVQSATVYDVYINMENVYMYVATYDPYDDPINGQIQGSTPIWIDLVFKTDLEFGETWENSTERIHHNFNVEQSTFRDSDHWVHCEAWCIDLSPWFVGHWVTFEATVTDAGTDDLSLSWDFDDGTPHHNESFHTYRPWGDIDPYPSPYDRDVGVYPMTVRVTVYHKYTYEGDFDHVSLTAHDDDRGLAFDELDIDAIHVASPPHVCPVK